jgi:hypothetical protein
MKIFAKPIRSTIVFGAIAAAAYIPIGTGFSFLGAWPVALHLTLWTLLAGYGVLLARWSYAPVRSMGRPFLLLLAAALFSRSTSVFFFSAFAVVGWMRSGICFKNNPAGRRFAAEIGLGSAGAWLTAGAVPGIAPVWALGVLMFFLIQALYFVILKPDRDPQFKIDADTFEKAKTAAENILDSAEKEIII